MKQYFKPILIVVLVIVFTGMLAKLKKTQSQLKDAKQNEVALFEGMRTEVAKNKELVAKTNALQLEREDFKRLRAEDAKKMKDLGVKISNLDMYAKTQSEINIKLKAQLGDTTITKRDPITQIIEKESKFKTVNIDEPYLKLTGMITETEFLGDIKIPVTIRQYVEVLYGKRFLWWRWKVKGFQQTIHTDNPYVDIKYAEIIHVGKTKRK